MLKEEQEAEQPRKQGRKQAGKSSGRRFSRAMLAGWGDSTEEDEGIEEEDGSDLNEEEMAMITRKFKKFFKKAKENSKRKTSASLEAINGSSSLGISSVVSMTTL